MKEVPSDIRKILIKRLKEYRFMQDELIDIEEELDSTPSDDNGNIKYEQFLLYQINIDAIEIIGNIYDNRDLLKESD